MRKILYIIPLLFIAYFSDGQSQGENVSGSLNIKPKDLRRSPTDNSANELYILRGNWSTGELGYWKLNLSDTINSLISSGSVTLAGDVSGLSSANSIGAGKVTYSKLSQGVKDSLFYKVNRNANITGATKTKITYDTKGLVTSGADATTADISDSSNKRYVTDAQLVVIGNTSGTNTGDQNLAPYLLSATAASTYAPINSPTFTGTVTIPTPFTLGATSVTATGTQINYLSSATGTTGTTSTNLVFSTSPTLVTPILGAATATSINGLGITSSTGTLTIANGKTLTVSNTLTFTGTDASSVNFGTGGSVVYSGGDILLGAGGSVFFNSRSIINSGGADGVIKFSNWAGTDFTRLVLGGTTSSYPAIAKNGTGIEIKLADNSAYTGLTALTGTFNTSTTTPALFLPLGSGTNRDLKLLATNSGTDNFAGAGFYPSSGTNVGSFLQFIPKGTGYTSAIKAQMSFYNTDFIADASNYEVMVQRAAGTDGYGLFSFAGGTGSLRNIWIAANGNTSSSLANIVFGTDGNTTLRGNFVFGTDNTYDIGSTSTNKPRTGYFGTSLYSPIIYGSTSTTGTLQLRSSSGSATTGSDIIFGDNDTEWARFSNTGFLGVGKTAGARLDIASGGDAINLYTARFSASGSAGDSGGVLFDQGSTNAFKIQTSSTGGSSGAFRIAYITQSTGAVLNDNLLRIQADKGVGFGGAPVSTVTIPIAPTASANIALLSLGDNGFSGSANHYASSASGSYIGINAASSFAGNFVDYQKNGVSKFKVDNNGVATLGAGNFTTTDGTSAQIILISTTGNGYMQIKNNVSYRADVFKLGSGYSTYKTLAANDFGFYNYNEAGNISILNDYGSGKILLTTGGASTAQFTLLPSGNIGFGQATPTAVLHLKAGTATASSAPLKLASGTNLTTAETGAVEYNGTNLFFTRTGTTRESVMTANAVNSVSPTSPNRTITVVIDGTTYYIAAKTSND